MTQLNNSLKLIVGLLIGLSFLSIHDASAYTSEEEEAMVGSIVQTDPGTTTSMSPGNAVIATVAERAGLIQQNMSLGFTYEESVQRVDSLYAGGNNGPKKVIVTEQIPGATCRCIATDSCVNVETRKFECSLDSVGLSGFQRMLRDITRWFIYITMLLGVLALIGTGILWAWGGSENEKYAGKAKTWSINIIIGLAILFSFRFILGFLAPWIFI